MLCVCACGAALTLVSMLLSAHLLQASVSVSPVISMLLTAAVHIPGLQYDARCFCVFYRPERGPCADLAHDSPSRRERGRLDLHQWRVSPPFIAFASSCMKGQVNQSFESGLHSPELAILSVQSMPRKSSLYQDDLTWCIYAFDQCRKGRAFISSCCKCALPMCYCFTDTRSCL